MADAGGLELGGPSVIALKRMCYIFRFVRAAQAGLRFRVAVAAEQGRLYWDVERRSQATGDGLRLVVAALPAA